VPHESIPTCSTPSRGEDGGRGRELGTVVTFQEAPAPGRCVAPPHRGRSMVGDEDGMAWSPISRSGPQRLMIYAFLLSPAADVAGRTGGPVRGGVTQVVREADREAQATGALLSAEGPGTPSATVTGAERRGPTGGGHTTTTGQHTERRIPR